MNFLGIDPGTHRIGYGIVNAGRTEIVAVSYGVIENTGTDRAAHFANVEQSLTELLERHAPHAVGVERLFFATNRKTAMAVSEMRGVILACLSRHGSDIREFTPLQVKRSVCGYGKADKRQVQQMVRMILGIKEVIRPDDASDALAIAISCSAAGIPRKPS